MKAFAKFIAKYAGELTVVQQALSLLLSHLPVPRAEKEAITNAIADLSENVTSIVQSSKDLANVSFAMDANDKSAIVSAISKELLDKIPGIVQAELEKLTAPKDGGTPPAT